MRFSLGAAGTSGKFRGGEEGNLRSGQMEPENPPKDLIFKVQNLKTKKQGLCTEAGGVPNTGGFPPGALRNRWSFPNQWFRVATD